MMVIVLLITGFVMYGCYSKCVVVPKDGSREPVVIQHPQ